MQVPMNGCLRTTLGMTAEQVAARDATIPLLAGLGLFAGLIIGVLVTPGTTISLLQDNCTAHTVIERNEVSPNSLCTFVIDLVCVCPWGVNEL